MRSLPAQVFENLPTNSGLPPSPWRPDCGILSEIQGWKGAAAHPTKMPSLHCPVSLNLTTTGGNMQMVKTGQAVRRHLTMLD